MKKTRKTSVKILAVLISALMLMQVASLTSFAYNLTGGATFPFINYTMTEDFSKITSIPTTGQYQGWYYIDSSKNAASYAEVKDQMLHIHNDKTDTTNNGFVYWKMGKNHTVDKKDYPLDKGFVEFGFKFKIEGNVLSGQAASGNFLMYGSKRLLAIVGSKLYTGAVATSTCLTDSLTSGAWYSFKIGMNMDKGRTEYFYFNDELVEDVVFGDFNALYSAPSAATTFEIRPQFTGANSDHADVYIDDVFLKQYTAEFVSATVTNGEKCVNTSAPIVLEFGDTLTTESVTGITLTKNGTPVEGATASVSGKKVTINHPVLEEVSDYQINIPATIISEKNLKISGAKTISFSTGRNTTLYSTNFDNFSSTERASVGAAMTAAKIKSGGLGWQYVINGDYGIATTTQEKDAGARWGKNANYGLILDDKHNYALVDMGRLNIQSDTYKPSSISDYDNRFLRLLPPTAPQSGIIKFGFDYESTITSSLGTSGYVQNLIKLGSLAQIGYHNKKLAYWDLINGSWNSQYLNVDGKDTLLNDVKHRFDFVLDLDNNVATVIVDGVEHTNLPLNPNGKLNEIQLNTKTLKNNAGTAFTTNIKLDNVSLEIFDTPQVITKSFTGVAADENITLDFTSYMSNVTGVTIKDEKGTNVDFTGTLAANGYQYVINPVNDLKSSTAYTITVPAQINSDGFLMAEQVVTVVTEHGDDLYLKDYEITGSLNANATLSVKATFGNGSGILQNPWIGIALYDADHKLINIAAATDDFYNGDLKAVTANLSVPADIKAGAYVKIFAWENISGIKPLVEKIVYPEAE